MITVVIVSYNYGMFVAQAIDSVLAQTKQPDKILVVDDGAHDGVEEIATKFEVPYLIREQNLGILKNFNDILYNHIDTDRMMMLGADNWLHPLYVERVNLEKYDIISTNLQLVGDKLPIRHLLRDSRCVYDNGYWYCNFTTEKDNISKHTNIARHNFIHGSSIFNVQIARDVGGYEGVRGKKTGHRLSEDWMLWRKMLIHGNAKHYHVPEPLLYYRRHRFNFNG